MGTTNFVLLLTVAALSLSTVSARRYYTRAWGKVLCRMENGRTESMKGIQVKLKDRDVVFHDTFGTTRTNGAGYFSVGGSARDAWGKPDPFIQVVYDYHGRYGQLEVEGFAGITRKYSTSKRRYASRINFGNIVISDEHCRAYVHFYNGLRDYYLRTRSRVPYGTLHVYTRFIVHGGTPYAIRSRVNIPPGYRLSLRTAQHEIAHTVRHTLVSNKYRGTIQFTFMCM